MHFHPGLFVLCTLVVTEAMAVSLYVCTLIVTEAMAVSLHVGNVLTTSCYTMTFVGKSHVQDVHNANICVDEDADTPNHPRRFTPGADRNKNM